MTGRGGGTMSKEEKDKIAQEYFGKPYDELDTNQQKSVGGHFGGGKIHEMSEQKKQEGGSE
ncbi:hypothetical protein CHLRE_06g271500v5 [Chlamydomonas reinhardtii]|uniref:Uncharacterized protein n=1 Tax=Chlamydomonas reinhardtii TaxID=3055 RepID=A0A2K3DND1_CHLRE|nr:uncharacterized protein CHLRE_06g271500v5 [Chlamydomonas reinhardtii]PNW82045.1 hypothetical protein CHLRE_06g271500v5 [Chlamydomonas reinhardtii]